MTFDELLAEVYLLTKRDDLVAETKAAIKSATLKAHHFDFFSKDIYETVITADSPAYIHSIDYPAIISNFRAIKYLRKIDLVTGDPSDFIEVITPEQVLDGYKVVRDNVAYTAGRNIELRSDTEIQKLILGCYVNPIVTDAGYSSWVAELYPYAIVFEAARVLFKTIGYDEQSAAYNALAGEQFILMRNSALAEVGS